MLHLLILTLVVLPFELPLPPVVPDSWRVALTDVASELEIVKPDQLFAGDFYYDLRWVRDRYREVRGCPPLQDCDRFPSFETCQMALQFNWQHYRYLLARVSLQKHHEDYLAEGRKSTDVALAAMLAVDGLLGASV